MLAKGRVGPSHHRGDRGGAECGRGGERAGYACAGRPPPHGRPGSRARPARGAPARSCRRPRHDGGGRGRGGHREDRASSRRCWRRFERGPHRPVIARGKCSERLAGAEAYLPILEILDRPPPQHDRRRFRRDDEARGADVVRPGRAALARELRDERDPGRHQEHVAGADEARACRLLPDVSRVRPLVLLLDDLHWADVSTVDVLNYLAGRFDDMRLLVLVTYRPSDMAVARAPVPAGRAAAPAASAFVECPLEFLDRADVERYLGAGVSRPRAPAFVRHADPREDRRHPLFMVDLVRYLRDRGGSSSGTVAGGT